MQRYYDVARDEFGNPADGVSVSVYGAGTGILATIYSATQATDTPTTVITNPIVTSSDGVVAFAAPDADYDLYYTGTNITPFWRYRVNLFDSSTATTIPVSSISLAMPTQFSTAGTPGTSMTVTWQSQTPNYLLAGPTSGTTAAAPTFRALVAADVNPVAVDKSTNQTGIGGDKTWTGTATFNGAVTHGSTLTQTGAASFAADVTFGTNVDLVFDKTSKGCIGAAGTYGWKNHPFLYDGSTGASTAPTITVLQSGIRKWGFNATNTNELIFSMSMPFDYAEGTDIYPYVTWTTGGTNLGVTRWGMEYTLAKAHSQETLPTNTTIYVETAASGIALRPVTSTWAAVTGTNIEPDEVIVCRFFRDGAHGNDTQADVTLLLDFGIKYQTSRPFGAKNKTPSFYT